MRALVSVACALVSFLVPGHKSDYPWADGCSVNSVALAPGQSRHCQFRATSIGGWAFDDQIGGAGLDVPYSTVAVTHGATTTTYQSSGLTSCRTAIIAPGDRVRLTLTASVLEVNVAYKAGAGAQWDCTPHPFVRRAG